MPCDVFDLFLLTGYPRAWINACSSVKKELFLSFFFFSDTLGTSLSEKKQSGWLTVRVGLGIKMVKQ